MRLLWRMDSFEMSLSNSEYNILSTSDDRFFCQICDNRLPTFSNSFFDTSDDVNINDDLPCHTDVNIEDDQNNNIFDELKDVRRKHPNSFQCAYLNIKSFRNKYCSIK